MPRYFFDIDDGVDPLPDEDGTELPNPVAAYEAAVQLLSDMAGCHFRASPNSLTAIVRNEAGEPVSTVTLCLLANPPQCPTLRLV
jgi:predicted metal-binding protein